MADANQLAQRHQLLSMSEAPVVVLIGTGAGGICGGVNLKARLGFSNFVIMEKSSRGFGGTWRHQRYPGISCDIPAHYYSFSFEPNSEWTSEFPPAKEIQPYLERISLKYGLDSHTSFNTAIDHVRWNNAEDCWDVHYEIYEPLKEGQEAGHWKGAADKGRAVLKQGVMHANLIVNTSGPFSRPYTPDYPGQEKFRGKYIHCTEWDDSVELAGKRVAIVGSGPTAIQVVSEIAHKVSQLDVYQRTANWIAPYNNSPFTEAQKEQWRKDPAALKKKRLETMNNAESTWVAIEVPGSTGAMRYQNMCADNIKKVVKRTELHDYLIPKYPIGCKRICVDPGYLGCLNRPNVDLVCDSIKEVTAAGIVTDGKQVGGRKEREYDVIIWATGWGSFSFGRSFPIYGRDGKEVWEQWKADGIPRSFQGFLIHNYPSIVFSVGPQGNVWTSFIELIEQVCDFSVRLLKTMIHQDVSSIEVKPEAEKAWADFCKRNIGTTPYVANCVSYYKFSWDHVDDAGKQAESYAPGTFENPAWFPGTPKEIRLARENIKDEDLIFRPNKGRSWKAHAAMLKPVPGFGGQDPEASTFRMWASKSRRGEAPPDFRNLETRVWSRL